jgi:AcrR family transcriptional regulator
MNTYDNILETANRLFVKQGYTATSIRQIAQEIGISKATVYHHFSDKKTIILTLIDKDNANLQDILAIIRSENHPKRRIEVAVRQILGSLSKSVDILQVARREIPENRDRLQLGYVPIFRECRTLLAEAVQLGIDQGIFKPVDPAESARVLFKFIHGTFAEAYLYGDKKQSPEDMASSFLEIYFYGISNN